MQNHDFFLLQGLHADHLDVINGISFTSREIDVIACLLSVRGTSKISSLLALSPHTVVTHMRKIMAKLQCNSREAILDFVEKSGKKNILRQYYTYLCIYSAFYASLNKIAKLKGKTHEINFYIHGDDGDFKKNLILHLEKDLPQAGIKSIIHQERKQKAQQEENAFLILLKTKNPQSVPSVVSQFTMIDLKTVDNYYFAVFAILQKILPDLNFEKMTSEFKKVYEGLESHPTALLMEPSSEEKEGNREHSSQPKIFLNSKVWVGAVAIGFFMCWIIGFFSQNFIDFHFSLQGPSIQSDLVLPSDSVFLSRPNILQSIKDKLKSKKGIQTLALVGIGGVGKTTLARHYVHLQKSSVTWSIHAETIESIRTSFEALAEALAQTEGDKKKLKEILEIEDGKEQGKKVLHFVKKHLKSRPNWFLIFDNVVNFKTLQDYFPQDEKTWGAGSVILTTRDRTIENNKHVNHVISVEELSSQEMLSLFMKILTSGNDKVFTKQQREEAMRFLEKIPPYPLDVSIAAYYLKATQANYHKYLENLWKDSKDFEHIQQNLVGEAGEYGKTRYSVIALSLQELIKEHKDFIDLLLLISFMHPQNIPTDLLDTYKNGTITDNFVYNLKKYSLIKGKNPVSDLTPTISLHQSTQTILRAYLTDKLNLHQNTSFLSALGEILDNYLFNTLEKEKSLHMKLMVEHCNAFLEHKRVFPETIVGKISSKLGGILYHMGDYQKSKDWLELSGDILERTLGANSPQLAWTLAYLGDATRELGQYKKAKEILEKSLRGYRVQNPSDPKETAWILSRLSNMNRHMGYYKEAKDLLEEALIIYETHFPENKAKQFWVKTYLGSLHKSLGNRALAQTLLEESLTFHKKKYGENHPKTAWVGSYLGDVYRENNSLDQAQHLLEESLKIYEDKYGKDHIENVRILRNLGQVYLAQEKIEQAETFLQRAHKIVEHLNHPDLYLTFESLGDFYDVKAKAATNNKNVQEANQLKAQAIDAYRKAEGIIKTRFSHESLFLLRIEKKRHILQEK